MDGVLTRLPLDSWQVRSCPVKRGPWTTRTPRTDKCSALCRKVPALSSQLAYLCLQQVNNVQFQTQH